MVVLIEGERMFQLGKCGFVEVMEWWCDFGGGKVGGKS